MHYVSEDELKKLLAITKLEELGYHYDGKAWIMAGWSNVDEGFLYGRPPKKTEKKIK
jgi:hypothetical protein